MKPSQALSIIGQIVAQTRMTPAEHEQVKIAIVVLTGLVFPTPVKEPEKPKDEKSDKQD